MSVVRDAMVPEPTSLLATATAQDAGRTFADSPETRAVFVSDADGTLLGVVTRKTLVREVVAAGLDPRTAALRDIAEAPNYTIDASLPLDEGFHMLEELDLERVPVVEGARLVGVLSRAVVQRRLAEDEPPAVEVS